MTHRSKFPTGILSLCAGGGGWWWVVVIQTEFSISTLPKHKGGQGRSDKIRWIRESGQAWQVQTIKRLHERIFQNSFFIPSECLSSDTNMTNDL